MLFQKYFPLTWQNVKNAPLVPPLALSCGFLYLIVNAIVLGKMGFFQDNSFFAWGPPVVIMGQEVDNQLDFYTLLLMFFGHQLINCWISEVVYPYIINEIQDINSPKVRYRPIALWICFFFAIYSNLDLLIVVNATFSQVSFFAGVLVANSVAVLFINYNYLRRKDKAHQEQTREIDELTGINDEES